MTVERKQYLTVRPTWIIPIPEGVKPEDFKVDMLNQFLKDPVIALYQTPMPQRFPTSVLGGIDTIVCESGICSVELGHKSVATEPLGEHVHSWEEVGLTGECEFGCKVLRCSGCNTTESSHRKVYGCNKETK